MTEYLLPEELINRVLAYLSGQPYRDVAHLIDEMRKSKPVPVSDD